MKTATARKPKAPAVATLEPQQPDWCKNTPGEDDSYELVMWRDSSSEQGIYVTRAEFIVLKSRLAEMRGLRFTDPDYELATPRLT